MARNSKRTEQAADGQIFHSVELFSRMRLIVCFDTLCGSLQKLANKSVGGFENSRTQQTFQFGYLLPARRLGFEAGNQFLDFGFLGNRDESGRLVLCWSM